MPDLGSQAGCDSVAWEARPSSCQAVTFVLIVFLMLSHPLPEPVLSLLKRFVSGVEEGLQADAHKVGLAVAEHPGFDTNWVESHLIRAVIASLSRAFGGNDLSMEDLANGGVEVTNVHEGVERRFRLRRAKRDARGTLVVTTSSDSILTLTAQDPTLFDDEDTLSAPPPDLEQWVIAYLLHPGTLTFAEVSVARVAGVIGDRSPYRLKLADIVRVPHAVPLPPDFTPDRDDLDLPGEDEDRGQQSG